MYVITCVTVWHVRSACPGLLNEMSPISAHTLGPLLGLHYISPYEVVCIYSTMCPYTLSMDMMDDYTVAPITIGAQ